MWHEESKQWVLALAVHDHLQIWGSKDLKSWTHLSDFGKEYGTHRAFGNARTFFRLR